MDVPARLKQGAGGDQRVATPPPVPWSLRIEGADASRSVERDDQAPGRAFAVDLEGRYRPELERSGREQPARGQAPFR
jgi:hypothetical protein